MPASLSLLSRCLLLCRALYPIERLQVVEVQAEDVLPWHMTTTWSIQGCDFSGFRRDLSCDSTVTVLCAGKSSATCLQLLISSPALARISPPSKFVHSLSSLLLVFSDSAAYNGTNFGSDHVSLTISTCGLQASVNTLGSTDTVMTSSNVMNEKSFINPNKVVIELENLPQHCWNAEVAQSVVGSACEIIAFAPSTVTKTDLSGFRILANCVHPSLVPCEKILVIPEPLDGNSTMDGKSLNYKVIVHLLEVQEVTAAPPPPPGGPPDDSMNDGHGDGPSEDRRQPDLAKRSLEAVLLSYADAGICPRSLPSCSTPESPIVESQPQSVEHTLSAVYRPCNASSNGRVVAPSEPGHFFGSLSGEVAMWRSPYRLPSRSLAEDPMVKEFTSATQLLEAARMLVRWAVQAAPAHSGSPSSPMDGPSATTCVPSGPRSCVRETEQTELLHSPDATMESHPGQPVNMVQIQQAWTRLTEWLSPVIKFSSAKTCQVLLDCSSPSLEPVRFDMGIDLLAPTDVAPSSPPMGDQANVTFTRGAPPATTEATQLFDVLVHELPGTSRGTPTSPLSTNVVRRFISKVAT
ncbi:hypothetical protein EJB05_38965 [Eragrostis curvula]|uniref:Uncharacterized protein n=1 Tax=Eragrostis curvula TaxID=38414 RepID=A0A5J9TVR8_9POAL|nr:hypothetical protein EJB05_38965 [Eragrostis curvula]